MRDPSKLHVDEVLEGRRVFHLSDDQLLKVLIARGDDKRTLSRLAFLVKMFEQAQKTNPQAYVGLGVAIGLTQLYGRSINAGAPDHPFKNFDPDATVQSIIREAVAKAPDIGRPENRNRTRQPKVRELDPIPPVVRIHGTLEHDAFTINDGGPLHGERATLVAGSELGDFLRDADLAVGSRPDLDYYDAPSIVRAEQERRILDGNRKVAQGVVTEVIRTPLGNEHHIDFRPRNVLRADGKPREYHRKNSGEPSKMDRVTMVAVCLVGPFGKKELLAACVAKHPTITVSDVQNALYKMLGDGKLSKVEGWIAGPGHTMQYEVTDLGKREAVMAEMPFHAPAVDDLSASMDRPSRFQEPA